MTENMATPVMAQRWIDVVRDRVSELPFGDLVLTHYHAVRTLGAAPAKSVGLGAAQLVIEVRRAGDHDHAKPWCPVAANALRRYLCYVFN